MSSQRRSTPDAARLLGLDEPFEADNGSVGGSRGAAVGTGDRTAKSAHSLGNSVTEGENAVDPRVEEQGESLRTQSVRRAKTNAPAARAHDSPRAVGTSAQRDSQGPGQGPASSPGSASTREALGERARLSREGFALVGAKGPGRGRAHLLVWAPRGQAGPSPLGLASQLAELEQRGIEIRVVTLCLRPEEDAEWIAAVVEWLEAHGRAVILRTRVRLPRTLVAALKGRDLAIELELAAFDADVQRALLGAGSASAQELLLQAQHLRLLGLRVVGRLGPLLPGVHDRVAFDRLVAATRAADIHELELRVGYLDGRRLTALHQVVQTGRGLDAGALLSLTRAYRLPPTAVFESDLAPRYLSPERQASFLAGLTRMLREDPRVHEVELATSMAERRRPAFARVSSPGLFEWAEVEAG